MNNDYVFVVNNPNLNTICKSNSKTNQFINDFFLSLSNSIYEALSHSQSNTNTLNNLIYSDLIKFSNNPNFINAILSDENMCLIVDNELNTMIKNGEQISIRKAACNIGTDLLASEYNHNEFAIFNNAVKMIYDFQIQPKLSDKYKNLFELTPVQDNDRILSYKDKLILDTSRSFNFSEIIDGDINGESLFAKMDSQIAMQILTDIKNGLAQSESRQKEFLEVADEILNDEFKNNNFSIKNGEECLEKNFIETLKKVCQEKGIFFNFNKTDKKIKKEPEKLIQKYIKKPSIIR